MVTEIINNNNVVDYLHSKGKELHFHQNLPSSRMPAMEVILYDPSQLGPSLPQVGFLAVPTTFLMTRSPGANGVDFTPLLYLCLSFCW